jgi:hypothetical protein
LQQLQIVDLARRYQRLADRHARLKATPQAVQKQQPQQQQQQQQQPAQQLDADRWRRWQQQRHQCQDHPLDDRWQHLPAQADRAQKLEQELGEEEEEEEADCWEPEAELQGYDASDVERDYQGRLHQQPHQRPHQQPQQPRQQQKQQQQEEEEEDEDEAEEEEEEGGWEHKATLQANQQPQGRARTQEQGARGKRDRAQDPRPADEPAPADGPPAPPVVLQFAAQFAGAEGAARPGSAPPSSLLPQQAAQAAEVPATVQLLASHYHGGWGVRLQGLCFTPTRQLLKPLQRITCRV